MSVRGPARRPRLSSYRSRAAAGILVSVVAIAVVAWVLYGVIQNRARQDVERALQTQAEALAVAVVSGGRDKVGVTMKDPATFFADTRIVVTVDGVDVYWSASNRPFYARARATRGWATVTMSRFDPISGVNGLFLVGILAVGVGAAAGIAWVVSGTLARRLTLSLRSLSTVAQRVSEGQLDARADETPDEVGALAVSFNAMATRLEASDARQREFLADVAHELRTPVTAIEGFAAALQDGTARDEEDRREAAEIIREEAARLRVLVRDLQELTWLDLDPPVERRRVDLADLAREAVARFQAEAVGRGITMTGPDGAAPVTTDPAHVTTILANLVSNALRATPAGGSVTLTVGEDGGDAFFAVSDTGRGIREEHIPFLFDRLFRVDSARARGGDAGSGLGLSIVKRLVLLLNGRISVRSAIGEGTTFTVWLLGARQATPDAVTSQPVGA